MKPSKIVFVTAVVTFVLTIGLEVLLYSKGWLPGQAQIMAVRGVKPSQSIKEAEDPTRYAWIIQAVGHPEGPGGVSKPDVIVLTADNASSSTRKKIEPEASPSPALPTPSPRWKKVKIIIRKGSLLFTDVEAGNLKLAIGDKLRLQYGPEQKGIEIESAEGDAEHNFVISLENS